MRWGTALNIAEIPVFILCGGLWNDPCFAISWPAQPRVISDKDAQQRDFDPVWHLEG